MSELVPPQRYVSPAEKLRIANMTLMDKAMAIRAEATAWVDIVFPERMYGVARIPRNQLDWSLAVAIVQVLFERNGDVCLLDRVRRTQVCVDTDVGSAWACPLEQWGTDTKFAAHLNTDDLVFIFP